MPTAQQYAINKDFYGLSSFYYEYNYYIFNKFYDYFFSEWLRK